MLPDSVFNLFFHVIMLNQPRYDARASGLSESVHRTGRTGAGVWMDVIMQKVSRVKKSSAGSCL